MKKKEKKKKFDTDKVSGAEYDENNVSTEMTDGGLCVKPCSLLHNILL